MDTTTLIIIIVVVLAVMYFMNRSRGGYANPNTRNTGVGPERPTYDDPDYTSTGSIGGTDRTVLHERSVGDGQPSSGATHDDPNYRSGGSIGGA